MGRQLTKNFHSREFDCKDGTPVPKRDYNGLEALCRQFLEPMRKKYGRCTVHSGYRTKSHNDAVGGASASYHRYPIHDGNDQASRRELRKRQRRRLAPDGVLAALQQTRRSRRHRPLLELRSHRPARLPRQLERVK